MPHDWPANIIIPAELDADDAFIASAPDAFVCCITCDIMRQPAMVTRTGRTYDRAAIERWISEHRTDPMSRTAISLDDLVPNLAIRALIESFVSKAYDAKRAEPGTVPSAPVAPASSNAVTAAAIAKAKEVAKAADPYLFPRRRLVAVAPVVKVTDVTYPDASALEENPAGKWFRFRMDDLTAIVGDWSCKNLEAYKTQNIKAGDGATFVAKRTLKDGSEGKSAAVIVFGGPDGLGVGCWNPAGYANAGDWAVGDTFTLLNYSSELAMPPLTFPLSIAKYETHSGTGWNLPGEVIRFGQSGLVGDWWKTLDVEFVLHDIGSRVYGVHTDAPYEALPFTVTALRADGEWHEVELAQRQCPWGKPFKIPLDDASSIRVRWETTDLGKLPGSTYRSGGGLHANIVGCTTSIDVLGVSEVDQAADGSYFRFDVDAMAAAIGGEGEWEGTYDCFVLRTGKTGRVTFNKPGSFYPVFYKATASGYDKVTGAQGKQVVAAPVAAAPADRPRNSPVSSGCCFSSIDVDETEPTGELVHVISAPENYVEPEAKEPKPSGKPSAKSVSPTDVFGIGWFEKEQKPGDWCIGDIILLKRTHAGPSSEPTKPGNAKVGTDQWLLVHFPDPLKPNATELVLPMV